MKKYRRNDDISLLGRIVVLFRKIRNKIVGWHLFSRFMLRQKELACYVDKASCREAKVAYAFGIARVVFVILLCVVFTVTMVTGSGIISYENVYYMFKDIGYINSFSESVPEILSYSKPINNQDFASFKNGLAVVGDNELKFFTSSGRTTLAIGSDFTNPKIVCSNSSALVYDQGRCGFDVYNSFIKIKSDDTDLPISSAHMSPSGSFCIVTSTRSYSSAVRFYNKNYELEWEYLKNDYVISARISDNGKYIAVLSLGSSSGESKVTLNLLNTAKGELISSNVLNGVMPYGAYFLSNDRVLLVCDDTACVYNVKGKLIGRYDYHEELAEVAVDENGFALIFDDPSVNLGNLLLVFDDNGRLEYSSKLVGNILDLSLNGDNVFALCSDRVLKINSRYGSLQSVEFSEENSKLLVLENGAVLICTPVAAYHIEF